jgi:ABC-2 type transport system permease protein
MNLQRGDLKLMVFLSDFKICWQKSKIWTLLARREIRFMYKRTKLGVWWLVLENLLQVLFISIFASLLFERDWVHYILHVTTGLLGFELLIQFLTNGSRVFSDSVYLTTTKFPPLLWIFKQTFKQFLLFRYEFLTATFVIIVLHQKSISFRLLLLFIIVFFVFLFGFSITITMGIIGLRFRDFQYLLTASIRMLFFLTPVFWSTEELPSNSPLQILEEWNPLAIVIHLIRFGFALSDLPTLNSLILIVLCFFLSATISVLLYNKYSRSLRIWL